MRSWTFGLLALWCGASAAFAGTLSRPAFTGVSALSSNAEIARRMLTPLSAAKIPGALARLGKELASQPVDPAKENFVLYVPDRMPPNGYSLIVFVPPWQDARLPGGWGAVLDDKGVIFVSAAQSGNDEDVRGRRVPLALLAEANVAQRYRLDPSRIIIAGFSGGSRVALRIALTYPDVFRGALLDAGSDPIGSLESPIPPRDLMERFQTSHLVFVTGDGDTAIRTMDAASQRSLRRWCVTGIDRVTIANSGHGVASASALSEALHALDTPIEANDLAECRTGIARDLTGELEHVESLIAGGDGAAAALARLDAHYGGLAAPKSLELARRIAPN